MNFSKSNIKKFFLCASFLIFLTVIVFIYNVWVIFNTPLNIVEYLNDYEKNIISKIDVYSQQSKKQKSELSVYFKDLTKNKAFDRVEVIGCYDIDWNKRIRLKGKFVKEVNKKMGSIEDFFMTILLISNDEVAVLKLNRGIGDFKNSQQRCDNYKKCILSFTPKEESWDGKKYIHQYLKISEVK